MIYRNGLKEFLITTVSFGLPMSLLFIIRYGVPLGLAGGILSGLLFGGIMSLMTRGIEKKFAATRADISQDRAIICEGGATWQGIGGWLFFTEKGLEFYPHKFNHAKNDFAIPTEDILLATSKRNILVITMRNGGMVTVVVSKSAAWVKQIQAALVSPSDHSAP
jgi:hypothetical protein